MPDAREFAISAHGDQMYGDDPYIVHLDEVAEIVMRPLGRMTVTIRPFLREVAYLHDVLEDTDVTPEDLRWAFGDVAESVILITDPPGLPRALRKKHVHGVLSDLKSLTTINRAALVVKAADRLANVSSCARSKNSKLLAMYQKEHLDFRKSAFRHDLCNPIWALLDRILAAPISSPNWVAISKILQSPPPPPPTDPKDFS